MNLKNFFIKITVISILINETKNSEIKRNSTNWTKQKRSVFGNVLQYPYNACSGILVALAIPLVLDENNVFVSYNFEANFNMPNQANEGYPGPIIRLISRISLIIIWFCYVILSDFQA